MPGQGRSFATFSQKKTSSRVLRNSSTMKRDSDPISSGDSPKIDFLSFSLGRGEGVFRKGHHKNSTAVILINCEYRNNLLSRKFINFLGL